MRKTLKKKITQVTVCLLKWREVILTVRKLGRKLLHKTGSGENLETFFSVPALFHLSHTQKLEILSKHIRSCPLLRLVNGPRFYSA